MSPGYLTAVAAGLTSLRSSVFGDGGSILPSVTSSDFNRVKFTEPSVVTKNKPQLHATAYSYPANASAYVEGPFTQVAVDASGKYIAAITSGFPAALYISNTGGGSYKLSNQVSSNLFDIEIAANAPQYMIVGTYGMYGSSNYGASFSFISGASNACGYWGDVTITGTGQYAYAVAGFGCNSQIYSSSNYLASFSLLANSPSGPYLQIVTSTDGSYIYAVQQNSNRLYYSNNHGSSWNVYSVSDPNYSPSYNFFFGSLATNSNGQYVVMTDNYGYVLFSTNYGKTFEVFGSYSYFYYSVAISSTGQYIYAANYTGVTYSNNYGASYQGTSAPPVSYSYIAAAGTGMVVASSNEGAIYKSSNAGSSWGPHSYDWTGVAMSQDGSTTMAITGSSYYGFASKTTNGGSSWLQTGYFPPHLTCYYDVACDATCTNMIVSNKYLGEVFTTSNGGDVWNSYTLFTSSYYTATNSAPVAISANGQYMITGGVNGYLYSSLDAGITFTLAVTPKTGTWTGVAMSTSGQYGYAALNGSAIIKSVSYAVSWISANSANLAWSSVSCDETGQHVLATVTNSNKVYVSSNYGVSWSSATATTANWISSAVSGNGQYMYVAAAGMNAGIIYASTNSGSTWSQLASAPAFNYKSIACDSTGQYVTAVVYPGQVYRSSNYGATWTAQNIVFKTTNDFGTFYLPGYLWDDDITTLTAGAIAGIVIGVIAFCGCIAAIIGILFFGLCAACQKQSILKEATAEVEMDKA